MGFKWNHVLENQFAWPNPAETRRMAAYARERGVTLALTNCGAVVVDPRDARPHAVTLLSCDCGLFARAGGCQHVALLQTEMNCVPEAVLEESAVLA